MTFDEKLRDIMYSLAIKCSADGGGDVEEPIEAIKALIKEEVIGLMEGKNIMYKKGLTAVIRKIEGLEV